MAQAFWSRALQQLLPGQLSSPPVPAQLSAWLPVRHALREMPLVVLLLQPSTQRVPAQALRPLRSWVCVHASWELGRRVLRALLPSWRVRDAAEVAVAAVPAENTAPGT